MRKTAFALAAIGALGLGSLAAPSPAEARGGFGPAIGGFAAGAVIAGLATAAYGASPYGYYGDYGPYAAVGYAPAYGGWGYDDGFAPGYGYTTVGYGYGPAYYGYRRAFRPGYAYYGRPWGHRHWHHHW